MDDKRFEEIMGEYVESNKQDKNSILQKFHAKKEAKMEGRSGFSKVVIALGVCLMAAVLALAIYLPIRYYSTGPEPHRQETRLDVKYDIAYAEEYSTVDFQQNTTSSGLKIDYKYKFDTLDEFIDTCLEEKLPFTSKTSRFNDIFFEEKSLILIFSYGTEYHHCRLAGVSKTTEKLIVTVSKPKENVVPGAIKDFIVKTGKFDEKGAEQIVNIFKTDKAFVYMIEVDKNDVKGIKNVEVEVVYSEGLLPWSDVVEGGLISEEDAEKIDGVYTETGLSDLNDILEAQEEEEVLDAETKRKIKEAYLDSLYEWLQMKWPDSEDKVKIWYLGTYNGYIATCCVITEVNIGLTTTPMGFPPFFWKE